MDRRALTRFVLPPFAAFAMFAAFAAFASCGEARAQSEPPTHEELVAAAEASDREVEKLLENSSGVDRAFQEIVLAGQLRSNELWRATGDRGKWGWSLLGSADTRLNLRAVDEAIDEYDRARALGVETGDAGLEGSALAGIGLGEWMVGESESALERFVAATPLLESAGDDGGVRMTLSHQALALADLGRWAEAEQVRNRLLAVARESGSRGAEAAELHQIGVIAIGRGERERGIRALEESLAIRRTIPMQHAPQGPAEHTASLAEARTLQAIGEALAAAGDREAARRRLEEALAMRVAISDLPGEGDVRRALARLAFDGQELDLARREIDHSLEILESQAAQMRRSDLRASFLARNRASFTTAIEILAALDAVEPAAGHAEAAFELSERARARNLRELLLGAEATAASGAGAFSAAPTRG